MEKLSNSVKITLIIVAGVILLGLIALSAFNSVTQNETVRVNCQATVQAVPDLVTVYFNVETKADTSAEAKDANTEIVNQLRANILALGFEDKDIVSTFQPVGTCCQTYH